MTRVLPLLVLLAAHPASAQPSSTKPSCARVQNIQFPADDRPNAVQKARLKGCDSEDLYYGIAGPADPVKARLCAYQQMDSREELVFGGEAILMMVYAIGAGASRNPDLAIKLACVIEGAPAELDGRLRHLEALKDQRTGRVSFDLCDDITSGFMMGYCAAHDQRLARARRQRRWKSHFEGWAPAAREAFSHLRAMADAFFHARSRGEIDLSGTARAAIVIEEEERLEDSFVAMVDQLEAGNLPAATSVDYRTADRALNMAYDEVMKADATEIGTVTKADIRTAERAWIRYRDEWVRFARSRYPAVMPEAITTWLTQQRTKQLRGEDR